MQYSDNRYNGRRIGVYPPRCAIGQTEKKKVVKKHENEMFNMMKDIVPYMGAESFSGIGELMREIDSVPRGNLNPKKRSMSLFEKIIKKNGTSEMARMFELSRRFSGRRLGMKAQDMGEIIKEFGGDEKMATMFSMFSKMSDGGQMNPMDLAQMMGGNSEMANMMRMMSMMNNMGAGADMSNMMKDMGGGDMASMMNMMNIMKNMGGANMPNV